MTNSSFKIVSFYTVGNYYEKVVQEKLIPSLQQLNLEFDIVKVADRGSWLANISYKPSVILETLNKNKSKNIVYLDADASVECYPDLFDVIPEEYDIGFHLLDHSKWYNKKSDKKEVFNGTIFFRNNDKVISFVMEWRKKCFDITIGEHQWFERLINKTNIVKCYHLPLEYSYIFSLPGNRKPFIKVEKPVIVHYQASRNIKRKYG
jgi:hypothetical protein